MQEKQESVSPRSEERAHREEQGSAAFRAAEKLGRQRRETTNCWVWQWAASVTSGAEAWQHREQEVMEERRGCRLAFQGEETYMRSRSEFCFEMWNCIAYSCADRNNLGGKEGGRKRYWGRKRREDTDGTIPEVRGNGTQRPNWPWAGIRRAQDGTGRSDNLVIHFLSKQEVLIGWNWGGGRNFGSLKQEKKMWNRVLAEKENKSSCEMLLRFS